MKRGGGERGRADGRGRKINWRLAFASGAARGQGEGGAVTDLIWQPERVRVRGGRKEGGEDDG